jgi:hypothetical protein
MNIKGLGNKAGTALCLLMMATLVAEGVNAQQDYAGFPVERVRMVRPEGHIPTTLYTQQRVTFQNVVLSTDGRGMTISGGLITDFEADAVPAGSDLPRGQLPVAIEVELYQTDTNLRRRDGGVEHPRLNPTDFGRPIEGQSVRIVADEQFGPYGFKRFQLPTLERPLAPGVYRLVARVYFAGQSAGIRDAMKWCSDWYGGVVIGQDEFTNEPIIQNIMSEPELHDDHYKQLLDNVTRVQAVTVMYIGDTLRDGNVNLVSPTEGTPRNPSNYLLWHSHVEHVNQVVTYENMFAQIEETLAEQRQRDGVNAEMIRNFERMAEIARQTTRDNITMLGGETSRDELNMLRAYEAARPGVLESILQFENYLTQRYWVLTEGYLLYKGWHTMNNVGFNAFDAVERNDNKHQPQQRRREQEERMARDGSHADLWQQREHSWRFQPRESWQVARTYLRNKEEQDAWDADKFTIEDDGVVLLDVAAFAEFRLNHIISIIETVDPLIEEVRTTNQYANQIWPSAFQDLLAARRLVLALGFSWEHTTRVRLQEEDSRTVMDDFRRFAEQVPQLELTPVISRATAAPGSLLREFEALVRERGSIFRATGQNEFRSVYRRAIEAGAVGAELPGSRRGE